MRRAGSVSGIAIGVAAKQTRYLAALERRRPPDRSPRQPSVAAEAKLLKRNRRRRRVALFAARASRARMTAVAAAPRRSHQPSPSRRVSERGARRRQGIKKSKI